MVAHVILINLLDFLTEVINAFGPLAVPVLLQSLRQGFAGYCKTPEKYDTVITMHHQGRFPRRHKNHVQSIGSGG
jgi:hypothetical protein